MHTNDSASPLISVIAVSYNHERWILETLNSIKAQTLPDFELIYADDASGDRSVEIAAKWLTKQRFPIQTILHDYNRGICRTLNEALRCCRGRYLQLISCDDVLLPDKFESQTRLMNELGPEWAVVFSDAFRIDANSRRLPLTIHSNAYAGSRPPEGDVFRDLARRNFIPAMSTLMRRDAVNSVGNYDEGLKFEDYDMWLRLARRYRFAFSDNIAVCYRLHEQNFHTTLKLDDHLYWIYRKHLDIREGREAFFETVRRLYLDQRLTDMQRADLRSVSTDARHEMILKLCISLKIPHRAYSAINRGFKRIKRLTHGGRAKVRRSAC